MFFGGCQLLLVFHSSWQRLYCTDELGHRCVHCFSYISRSSTSSMALTRFAITGIFLRVWEKRIFPQNVGQTWNCAIFMGFPYTRQCSVPDCDVAFRCASHVRRLNCARRLSPPQLPRGFTHSPRFLFFFSLSFFLPFYFCLSPFCHAQVGAQV